MIYATRLLLVAVFTLPGCFSNSPSSTRTAGADSRIKILLDRNADEPSLVVMVTAPVNAVGDNAGEVQITIVNLLEEEVFLEVTPFDSLSFSFSFESEDGKAFAIESGGGGFTLFPDNTHLLKRLHATVRSEDGKRFTCGCAAAHIKEKLGTERGKTDLKRWARREGAKMNISIPVYGYFRNSGKRFGEIVDVPIEIVDGE